MQQETGRRSNRERSDETRERLIEAARRLFVDKSYAETGTPEIAREAGVTRGALYHHFADKQALFAAVVEREASTVADEIERHTTTSSTATIALIEGGEAYLKAMAAPGRTRLLLLDGPAVLGRSGMDEVDNRHGNRTLKQGLEAAIKARQIRDLPLDALTGLLGAAFDRAALAIDAGADAEPYRTALAGLIEGLVPTP
ncbi:MAG: TetR family transcriptional regulator [Nitratireductor sp.]|uniref:TetR/AcrR family transcriptional regulator n=1 Tax=Nitratireductor sp. B36 TaxID=2762059 RepID=UPI000C89713A|nr:TetR/AcrR family transcriptional regulator [Nitratireductor sp. B36]MAS13665.1 TetR family transcriptional regulator [Nitratireductor sp.]MCC5779249.1 TetR/AcrR family transcriptional regulator [Nitratireductor sp. B36]